MNALYLITAHLLGDFVLQSDWIAQRKTRSHLVCSLHCLIYVACVLTFTFGFLPWWAYLLIFVSHYPVDRWRLARKLMNLTGSNGFATGEYSPWSVFVVDQVLHLATLSWISMCVGGVSTSAATAVLLAGFFAMLLLVMIFLVRSFVNEDADEDERVRQKLDIPSHNDHSLKELDPVRRSVLAQPLAQPAGPHSGKTRTVSTFRGFVIDFPRGSPLTVKRVFLPVLDGDVEPDLEGRLRIILNAYTNDLDLVQQMVEVMRGRYNDWKELGDSVLDVTSEPHSVIVRS